MAAHTALAEESAAGTVQTLRGEASAEGSKPRRPLQAMALVFLCDLIETAVNSALTMRLGKATVVKLGSQAKFRIDNFVVDAGGTFDLDQGPMLIDHNGWKDEDPQVRSPFDLMAVRGSMFFAGPSNGVFGVFVARGLVAVTGGGRTVILRPGLGTNIANLATRRLSRDDGDLEGLPQHCGRWSDQARSGGFADGSGATVQFTVVGATRSTIAFPAVHAGFARATFHKSVVL